MLIDLVVFWFLINAVAISDIALSYFFQRKHPMATTEKKPDSSIVMMIDIETLSLRPTAFVTQFGFCVADWRTREMLIEPTNIWLREEGQPGKIDFDTVKWWASQKPEVTASVFNPPETGLKMNRHMLFSYIERLLEATPDITVWAAPAMYDLPILTNMWDGRKPWKYNNERDMMTLYKLLDPHGIWKPPSNNMAHDAASDAGWQMEYLFSLMALLESNNMLARPVAANPAHGAGYGNDTAP